VTASKLWYGIAGGMLLSAAHAAIAAVPDSISVTVSTAAPAATRWNEYQIIYWQRRTAPQYEALKSIGVTATMLMARRDEPSRLTNEDIAPLLSNNLHWYVENSATDFYAPYHRFVAGQRNTEEFLKVQAQHQETPSSLAPFMRHPSLSDPKWLLDIRERLMTIVRTQKFYSPLYYSLGDETGVADLAAAWDFDFSPQSLSGMREWLRQRYPSLDALNAQWGTHFADWESVTPDTTDTALKRTDDNFSAWSDFKEWMDEAFARALKAGTDAVHAADPTALAAIEGAQIPGWGGYDYSRLAHAVDVMEIYDHNDNVEIARSLNSSLIMLKTADLSGPRQAPDIWRSLFRGTRGLILWDAKQALVDAHGAVGPVGQQAASLLYELRSLGPLFINGERRIDPVAVLYSPESFRIHWILDRRREGTDWSRRKAGTEYGKNAYRSAMESYTRVLEHRGVQPRYVTEDMIADLHTRGIKILILPHAIAMSREAADAVLAFAKTGGTVIVDEQPAIFDRHGRRLRESYLVELFSGPPNARGAYLMEARSDDFPAIVARAGVTPEFGLTGRNGEPTRDIEIYRFQSGDRILLALLRDKGAPSGDEPVTLVLPRLCYVQDMRAGKPLGRSTRIPSI
jgi:hypothetical protein